jgi:hypothetical protein
MLDLAVRDRARIRPVAEVLLPTGLCKVRTKLVLLRPVCRSCRLNLRECCNVNGSVKKTGNRASARTVEYDTAVNCITIFSTISRDHETTADRYDENESGPIGRKKAVTTGRRRERCDEKTKQHRYDGKKNETTAPSLSRERSPGRSSNEEPLNRWVKGNEGNKEKDNEDGKSLYC